MNTYIKERRDEGFTLIELLIAIVVVGILTAVVIVGIGGLTDNGKRGACQASKDAAKAASAVYYNNNSGQYPNSFDQLTAGAKPALETADGVTATGTTMAGNGWSVTMSGGGGTANTFSACP
jgi:prepilin-type N-terminal cleavage/methylation domain-containing protein